MARNIRILQATSLSHVCVLAVVPCWELYHRATCFSERLIPNLPSKGSKDASDSERPHNLSSCFSHFLSTRGLFLHKLVWPQWVYLFCIPLPSLPFPQREA